MIRVILVRHGKTEGNILKQYVGREDQSLSKTWLEEYKKNVPYTYPDVEMVFVSPLQRCRQTAEIIYPTKETCVVEGLVECDFGDFSGKTYEELKNSEIFKTSIDDMGVITFPNGEDGFEFRARCTKAFLEIMEESRRLGLKEIAVICHGGTIMAILEKFSEKERDFYFWQVGNMGGYDFYYNFELEKAVNIEKLLSEEL